MTSDAWGNVAYASTEQSLWRVWKAVKRQKYQTEKTADGATGEIHYVAASYSAKSFVMITHESECAFFIL